MKKTLMVAAIASLLGTSAFAQSAGTWMVRAGATRISPHVSSGNLSAPSPAGTQTDVGSNTQPSIAITYSLTDHFSLELPLAPAFKHKLYGAGAIAGAGQIGETRALPMTLFFQYRFGEAAAKVRPYVMLGATYAYFYGERGSAALNGLNPANPPGGSTQLDVKSKFALTPGLGATFRINDKWFADVSYAKTFLKTTTTLSTGQTIDTKLNPSVISFGIGMMF
ncbi:MAG: OmpW family protein [Ramlibacter sp.]|nr:OmpW family protein [Ramlibacter sp.]MCW5652077.1 OmpW family protein [Ramlibacter sp.]